MWHPGCDLCSLNGVHPQAVVPVTGRHKVLVVRGENKEFVRYFKIVSKWPSNVVPPGPTVTKKSEWVCVRGKEREREREREEEEEEEEAYFSK